jgi:hypothetical protein
MRIDKLFDSPAGDHRPPATTYREPSWKPGALLKPHRGSDSKRSSCCTFHISATPRRSKPPDLMMLA